MRLGVVGAAVLGGLIAGALDIEAAVLIAHVGPEVILKAIARGLLGRSAMQGGGEVVALGLVLQLGMGALIGLIYGLACKRLPILLRQWVIGGLAYGAGVFLVMNWVVVPLSAVRRLPRVSAEFVLQNGGVMLLFGLIVAGAAHLGARAGKT